MWMSIFNDIVKHGTTLKFIVWKTWKTLGIDLLPDTLKHLDLLPDSAVYVQIVRK